MVYPTYNRNSPYGVPAVLKRSGRYCALMCFNIVFFRNILRFSIHDSTPIVGPTRYPTGTGNAEWRWLSFSTFSYSTVLYCGRVSFAIVLISPHPLFGQWDSWLSHWLYTLFFFFFCQSIAFPAKYMIRSGADPIQSKITVLQWFKVGTKILFWK